MKLKFIMMMLLMSTYPAWAQNRQCTEEEITQVLGPGNQRLVVQTIETATGPCDIDGMPQPLSSDTGTNTTTNGRTAGQETTETSGEVVANGSPTPTTNADYAGRSASTMRGRGSAADKCLTIFEMRENAINAQRTTPPVAPVTDANLWNNAHQAKCEAISKLAENRLQPVNRTHQSMDGAIRCKQFGTHTIDFDPCVNASRMYDGVKVAEKAMDMQQTIRTQSKNNSIAAEAAQRQAQGDLQGGALDAGIAQHNHMKAMNTEKMLAYSASVAALVNALRQIPGEGAAKKKCSSAPACGAAVDEYSDEILANQSAKAALVTAIAEFTAKGLAAGIAMGNNRKAADAIEKAKTPFEDEPGDLMLERCEFNPADPACITPGQRVAGQSLGRGEFSLGDGGNNAFNLNPEGSEFGEVGAETNLDDSEEVSSLGNPFSDDAKRANDILNPAGAAQVQASGGAGSGGGGAGGGLGGGGASLGSDLSGADKDGDKEAQIKTGKVSGAYGAVGGGGYRGIARSKESTNPFASLFDQKGAGGGTEIQGGAAADIDGKTSGLFQKISKRYTRIHADKRIEAKNLE